MKIKLQTTEKVPAYAVYYLEYGEDDGGVMDQDDIINCEAWLERLRKIGYTSPTFDWGDGETTGMPYFSTCPAFGLPCDVVDCVITQFE